MPIHPTDYTEEDYESDKAELQKEDKMKGSRNLAYEIAASIANMLQEPNTFSPNQDWEQLVADLREIEEAVIDMEEEWTSVPR